jgi:tripartite-type tricarboxylate transporter receptor subunit TctC
MSRDDYKKIKETDMLQRCVSGLLLSLAIVAFGKPVLADTYPDKPIRLIVATAAGGASDILAHLMADKLGGLLHQSVIVEARPGANGNVAAEFVAHSPADGYTIMMGTIGAMAINASMYKNVHFDPIRDFAPIARLVSFSNILVVKTDLPVHSVAELIAYAKAHPDALHFGSPGVGGSPYMSMIVFNLMAHTKMIHVPYKGAAPALVDLMGGYIDLSFSDPLLTLPMVKQGKRIRALAVSGSTRLSSAPDLPTVAEAGLPGYSVSGWLGLVAPAGTPKDRITLLNTKLNEILQMPDVRATLASQGAAIIPGTPEEFGDFIKSEFNRWKKVVAEANIKIDD